MDADRLDALRSELRARERITALLGLDIERPLRSVEDGYPENAVTLVGKGAERVLKELWTRNHVDGSPSDRSLNDLIKRTRDHIDSSAVLDALRDIQTLRNRSTHDGYEIVVEDAHLALRRFVTVLEWFETNGSDELRELDVRVDDEVVERLRFVGGLYTETGFVLAKRFDLSATSIYLLYERVEGLRSEYIEVLISSSTAELAKLLESTGGSLLNTGYPKLTRFVLVQEREDEPADLPDSRVLTYQEFLDTVVDSQALAALAESRAAAIGALSAKAQTLEGALLTLDPTRMSFQVRHIRDVSESVERLCERSSANLLLIGGAGTGKTRLLATLASEPIADGRYRFFIDLADRRDDEPLDELVVRQLGDCFHLPRSQVWRVFTYLIRSGRCVCLVDAIDEGAEGGSLEEVVRLFGDLSVLLSASSTTIVSCRQSFLLDTPYVRQLLDEKALLSEKVADRLVSEGVDPLQLPKFSVLRIDGLMGTRVTPLLQALGGHETSLGRGVIAELEQTFAEIGMELSEAIARVGPLCLGPRTSVTLLQLLRTCGPEAFDGEPSNASVKLARILVPVGPDQLRFRHQVFREMLGALHLHRTSTPDPDLHGIKLTDQCRSFLSELGPADPPTSNGYCRPGNYVIGPPGEVRVHVLSEGFTMRTTPVTVAEYRRFLRAAELGEVKIHTAQPADADVTVRVSKLRLPEYYSSDEYGDFPATCLNWWGAWAYASWARTRLPTSTEWEVAARGVDGRLFPWGEDADIEAVNCADHWAGKLLPTWDEWKRAHDSGALRAGYPTLPGFFGRNRSPSGCLDMGGNVWEWTGSVLPDRTRAAIAGGSYDNPIRAVRCSSRGAYRLSGRSNAVGFRVLESLDA